jgi:hypothetical protein
MIQIKKVGSQEIQDAVKANDGYCPCVRIKSPDTKCMCKEFREQKEPGLCHCGLYQKIIED